MTPKARLILIVGAIAMFPLATVHAYSGGPGMLTVDGIPEEIVFRVGVPATHTIPLTLRRNDNATMCHGEVSSQYGIAGPLSQGLPCYDGPFNDISNSISGIDGFTCLPGAGSDGQRLGSLGGATPFGASTVDWEIVYDGSTQVPQSTWLRVFSDGRCHDVDDLDKHYEVARINIHFLSGDATHESFWKEPSVDSAASWFVINNPVSDGHADARLFVTDNTGQNEPATPGHYGVWWNGSQWSVYNENGAAMPSNRRVNVAFGGYGDAQSASLHVTDPSNTWSYITTLDHPQLNNNPDAHVLIQHVWNPPGYAANYHDHPTGVWYSTSTRRWTIYNEDFSPIPSGQTFFVMAAGHSDGRTVEVWPRNEIPMSIYGNYIVKHRYSNTSPNYLRTPVSIHRRSFYSSFVGWVHSILPGGTAGPSNDHEFVVWNPERALQ